MWKAQTKNRTKKKSKTEVLRELLQPLGLQPYWLDTETRWDIFKGEEFFCQAHGFGLLKFKDFVLKTEKGPEGLAASLAKIIHQNRITEKRKEEEGRVCCFNDR